MFRAGCPLAGGRFWRRSCDEIRNSGVENVGGGNRHIQKASALLELEERASRGRRGGEGEGLRPVAMTQGEQSVPSDLIDS